MRDLFLLSFWSVALPLGIMSPVSGVMFWIWDALLTPTELAYGFMAGIPTNKLIAAVSLGGLLLQPQKRDFYADRTFFFLVSLAITATISHLLSLSQMEFESYLYGKLIKEVVLALAIMYTVVSKRWIVVCTIVFSGAISFFGVKEGLISLLTVGGHKIIGSRAIGDNNQLALALLTVIPILIFLRSHVENRWLRNCILIVTGLDLVTIVMTFSRGGFVGLIVLAIMLLKNTKHRLRSGLIIVSICIIGTSLAPSAWFERVDTINDAASDGSFMGRVIAWKISILIAEYNPFFGGGFHSLQDWRVWSEYSRHFLELSWISTAAPDLFPHAAHSILFEIIGDLGLSGFVIYFGLFVSSFICLKKVRAVCRTHPLLLWAGDCASMMQVSLIVYLVAGLALSVAYLEMIFVLFALSSRLLRTVSQEVALIKRGSDSGSIEGRTGQTALTGARRRNTSRKASA